MNPLGQNNIVSNNSWRGMIATPNLQPAPGSNPFFNVPSRPLVDSSVEPQVRSKNLFNNW